MQAEEAKQMIRYMASTWNTKLDDQQAVVVWVETLAQFPAYAVRQAITELRTELDWMPTHRQMTDRTRSVLRRTADERGLDSGEAPRICELCEGTRWEPAMGGGVVRCRCQMHKGSKECRNGCSCLRCHYGPERASIIRAGIDGVAPSGETNASQNRESISSIRQSMGTLLERTGE